MPEQPEQRLDSRLALLVSTRASLNLLLLSPPPCLLFTTTKQPHASHLHLHCKQVHASKMADELENIPPSPAAAAAASDDKSPPASSSEPSSSTDSAPAAARDSTGVAKGTPIKKPAGTTTPGAAAKVRLSETPPSIRTRAHTPPSSCLFSPADDYRWHRCSTRRSKDCRSPQRRRLRSQSQCRARSYPPSRRRSPLCSWYNACRSHYDCWPRSCSNDRRHWSYSWNCHVRTPICGGYSSSTSLLCSR